MIAVGLEELPTRWLRQLVRILTRPDHRVEQGGGGEIGDREASADQVITAVALRLDPVEGGGQRFPAALHRLLRELIAPAHVAPGDWERGPESGPSSEAAGPRLIGRHEVERVVEVFPRFPEPDSPHVVAGVLVEEFLQLEGLPALIWIGGIERRVRIATLERLDDPRRVDDPLSVEIEDWQGPAPPREGHGFRATGHQRMSPVQDPLDVQRPADLLVVIGEAVLPEDGNVAAGWRQSTSIESKSRETTVGPRRGRLRRLLGTTRRFVAKTRPRTSRCPSQRCAAFARDETTSGW